MTELTDLRAPARAATGVRLLAAGVAALLLGVVTAYAQRLLPSRVAGLANSSGSWSMLAFLLALAMPRRWAAVLCGAVSLACLTIGYYLANTVRDIPVGTGSIAFWCAAALVIGPLLGLAASWIRSGGPLQAAAGAGGISGLLVGEGSYGLVYIADSTYPPYWWGELVAGVVLLAVLARLRLRRPLPVLAALGVTALLAVAFPLVYSHA